ncbi:MAG: putative metalloprotease CJM1_0395 family protein [Desulfobulbaceae bacterium]|nr:putative metalloprotease CJM1_0395 family protein [Desulfobulbaceae bacterium]
MAGLNALLSAYSFAPAPLGGASTSTAAPYGPQPDAAQRAPAGAQDVVFERGQGWKNRSRGAEPGEGNAAGGWRATAARRAYGLQAQSSGNLTDGGAEAEKAAAPADPGESRMAAAVNPTASEDASGGEAGAEGQEAQAEEGGAAGAEKPDGEPLTDAEKLRLFELRQADVSIRAHEQAHLAAAGSYARSGASYRYERGPDGRNYAVAGEVMIDTARESKPEQTISKMQVVRSAALAPAEPSPQDRRVAAKAVTTMADARVELRMMRLFEAEAARKEAEQEFTRAASAAGDGGSGSTAEAAGGEQSTPAVGDAGAARRFAVNVAAKFAMPNSAPSQYGVDFTA